MDIDKLPLKRSTKKGRTRTRTRGCRKELQATLDKALSNRNSAAFSLLAGAQHSSTTQHVPLKQVLSLLGESDSVNGLSRAALSKLGEKSSVFEVTSDGQSIRLRPRVPDNGECTAYLDNLPSKTDAALLEKLASSFGTVIDVQLPPPTGGVNGRKNKGFAFVRFASKDSVRAICEAFKSNFSQTLATSVVDSECDRAATLASSLTGLPSEAMPSVSTSISSDHLPPSTSLSENTAENTKLPSNASKKRKRRKRFKNRPRTRNIELRALKKLFGRTQAVPLSAYVSLRTKYFGLQKKNMGELKKKLHEIGVPAVKNRRLRGRDKLLIRAYDERFDQEEQIAAQSVD